MPAGKDPRRPRRSTTARGDGSTHQAIRTRLGELVRIGGYPCARCGLEIEPGEAWHLDHSDDRGTYLGPSHVRCNVNGARKRKTSFD